MMLGIWLREKASKECNLHFLKMPLSPIQPVLSHHRVGRAN